MTEYVIVGVASILIAWFAYRNLTLEKRVLALEATVSASELASPAGLQESVAQLIEELKATADSACNDLARRIDDIQDTPGKVGIALSNTQSMVVEESQGVPMALILEMARKGLNATEIARKARVTQGEVELTLRFHSVEPQAVKTSKRKAEQKRRARKEIALA